MKVLDHNPQASTLGRRRWSPPNQYTLHQNLRSLTLQRQITQRARQTLVHGRNAGTTAATAASSRHSAICFDTSAKDRVWWPKQNARFVEQFSHARQHATYMLPKASAEAMVGNPPLNRGITIRTHVILLGVSAQALY